MVDDKSSDLHIDGSIDRLNGSIAQIFPRFDTYVKDISIPLSDRWTVFAKAPSVLKTHGTRYLTILDFDISWEDDFFLERFETMDTLEFVSRIEQYNSYNDGYGEHVAKQMYPRLDEIKEYILSLNIGSWRHDW